MVSQVWLEAELFRIFSGMTTFRYQRQVAAYHGCDVSVRDQVIAGRKPLKPSENDYDWLGHGIYFWEQGPERAKEWAEDLKRRGKIENPSVIGAYLQLGQCFDLLDAAYTDILSESFANFKEVMELSGKTLPINLPLVPDDKDFLLRERDCAVLNWTIKRLEAENHTIFHSVRGVFQEGAPVFPDSAIRKRSHIQIAVRNVDCIVGYFLPS